MDPLVLPIGIAVFVIPVLAMVIGCSWWLVVSEKAYPRASFPVTRSDRVRGVVIGLFIGVAWAVCDVVLDRMWQRPGWDPQPWELRLAFLVMFVIAGRLTLVEIFRVARCRRDFPHSIR